MTTKRLVFTIDSHTQGEPTRLVIGSILHYPGNTMKEKQAYVRREHDSLRKALLREPRGHHDMFGGFITPPVSDDGHLGIIFMDNQGYLDMCGHGTIGLCTTLAEMNLVRTTPPRTDIRIDTPAGRVRGYALSHNGHVTRAGFYNVPSFCLSLDEIVEVEGLGRVPLAVAYGGNFFAIVPAEAVGVEMVLGNMGAIRRAGMRIKRAANAQLSVQHPELPYASGIDIVTFYGPAHDAQATYKNVHVFADGQVDRSPGGTGTSAMLAYLIASGRVQGDQEVVAEGLAGGLFTARMTETWQSGTLTYHTPEISGTAFVTGIHTFHIDLDDPLCQGLPSSPNATSNLAEVEAAD